MAERALELLALPNDGQAKMILDLGCGSGLSGGVLSASGHYWVGMDISRSMLGILTIFIKNFCIGVAQERLFDSDSEHKGEDVQMEITDKENGQLDCMEEEEETPEASKSNPNSSLSSDSNSSQEDEYSEDDGEEDAEKCLDLLLHDMGEGTCFRPGIFDGCISISALQWLCHSNRSSENPKSRLNRLFSTLFGCLSRGARAIFQFYPETSSQIDLILGCAMKAGFTGGLVIDFPNSSKAKKYYLCLMTGPSIELPKALKDKVDDDSQISVDKRSRKPHQKNKGPNQKIDRRGWVKAKKELARKRGIEVKSDSKYTARKRRIKF